VKTSPAGIALLKKWEGCELKAYQDGGGVWTIGYGLTTAAGIVQVYRGMVITQAQADDYLARALVKYERTVAEVIKRPMTQNQFDAMVSLCYNIGQGAFAGSTLVRRFNAGDIAGAADAFLMWTKDDGKFVKGLENRRKDERLVFLKASPTASSQPVEPSTPSPAPSQPATPPAAPDPVPGPSGGLLAFLATIITLIFGGRSK
jgi:lysozyme